MISKRFLVWQSTVDVSKRAAAASALGRAYLTSDMDFEDRCGAEAAMTLLIDDPSPKVRFALAEALASSVHAPAQIMAALARDQFDIAALVIARSPVLSDRDLETVVPTARADLQKIIARRPTLSNRLCRVLAHQGAPEAVVAMLDNINADLCSECRNTIVVRLGENADVRGRLLDDADLNVVLRYELLRHAKQALTQAPLLAAFKIEAACDQLTGDAFVKNLVHLLDLAAADDHGPLIEAMRANNDLTTALLVRAACFGKMDFLAHVFADLSGETIARVTAILVQDKKAPLVAMLERAGLSDAVQPIFTDAIGLWKQVAQGRLDAGPQEVTHRLSEGLAKRSSSRRDAANDDILSLLRSIYLETMRENARHHALALTEAAEEEAFVEAILADEALQDEAIAA